MPAAIRDLWPDDIKADESLAPLDILQFQADQLAVRTKQILSAEVVRSEPQDRINLSFLVYAPRIKRRSELFTVQHQKDKSYPAAIIAPDDNLPDFLQRRYYRPGPADMQAEAMKKMVEQLSTTGLFKKLGKGDWVEPLIATSPSEFTEMIGGLFASPSVKGTIISLISKSNAVSDKTEAEPAPDGKS